MGLQIEQRWGGVGLQTEQKVRRDRAAHRTRGRAGDQEVGLEIELGVGLQIEQEDGEGWGWRQN